MSNSKVPDRTGRYGKVGHNLRHKKSGFTRAKRNNTKKEVSRKTK